MLRRLALGGLTVLVLCAPAQAATRTKTANEIRFTLDGRSLTVAILDLPHVDIHPPPEDRLFGKRVRVACGTSFRFSRRTFVIASGRWPRGARSQTFRFRRDVSRRARWCVIAPRDGGGVTSVSFVRSERRRLLAKGRAPSGAWWRLSVWRGDALAPCMQLRQDYGAFSQCFEDDAEREAVLSSVVQHGGCFDRDPGPDDTFVYGATARRTRSVTIALADGTRVEATLHRRPRGSRVRAQYYFTVLPGASAVRTVTARDGEGRLVGREQVPAAELDADCGVVVAD